MFAGCDTCQGDHLTPAEGGSYRSKLFGDRAVIFFGMQRPVFTDGIFEQQIKYLPGLFGNGGR